MESAVDLEADASRLILFMVSVYGTIFYLRRWRWMGVFHALVAVSMFVFAAVPIPLEQFPFWAVAVNLATAAIAVSALHATRASEAGQ